MRKRQLRINPPMGICDTPPKPRSPFIPAHVRRTDCPNDQDLKNDRLPAGVRSRTATQHSSSTRKASTLGGRPVHRHQHRQAAKHRYLSLHLTVLQVHSGGNIRLQLLRQHRRTLPPWVCRSRWLHHTHTPTASQALAACVRCEACVQHTHSLNFTLSQKPTSNTW